MSWSLPRGIRTAAWFGSFAALMGCARVQAGLANAPWLGGAQIEPNRLSDVIANGAESCERSGGQGPLRGQLPPCVPRERAVHVVVVQPQVWEPVAHVANAR